MANRQTKQINEYAGIMSQALQSAYQAQANAISEASRIQSETADKNRELYQSLSDDIVSRFEAINEQNISYFKDASSQASQYLMPFINAARDPAPDSTLLRDLLGVNGFSAQQTATQNYLQSPQVQAALDMGVKAIDKSSAAAGMTQSGRALQELHNQGQQIATQSLGDYQNRLLSLFQTDQQGYLSKYAAGANAASALSQIGSGFAGQMSQSGLQATQGATGAIGSFGGMIGQQNQLQGNFLSNAQMQLGQLGSNYQMMSAAQTIEARKAANSMLSPDAWQASGMMLGAGAGAGGIFSTGGGNISGLLGAL